MVGIVDIEVVESPKVQNLILTLEVVSEKEKLLVNNTCIGLLVVNPLLGFALTVTKIAVDVSLYDSPLNAHPFIE